MLPIGLFLYDFQKLHGASLDTDATGNALGDRHLRLVDHDLHGASFYALSTADAQLLIDHINAGLGVLGDSTMLTGAHTLAALNAGHGLCAGAFCNDLDAGIVGVELFVKRLGASPDTFQTGHTFHILLNRQLLHIKGISFM